MDVVAAVLISEGRVLAARRLRPAGRWEFPGGKVEQGETSAAAIERECREELGVTVRAVAHLATASDDRIRLLVWHVELVAGTPITRHDHDELRWLAPDQLLDVDWLAVDRRVLAAVAELLEALKPPGPLGA